MKLSVAIISLAALLGGCATTPVMRPDVNAPPMNERHYQGQLPPVPAPVPEAPKQSDTPCWDKVQDVAGQAAAAMKNKYEEVNGDAYVKDAKEAAKKAGQALYNKATEAYDKATE